MKFQFHFMRAIIIVSLFLAIQVSQAQKFTLPVMPDTQHEVAANSEKYFSRFNWIAANKDHIPFVLHVGDLVDFHNDVHYDVASAGYDILDGFQIKYAIAVGNHDTEVVGEFSGSAAGGNSNANLRKTNKFNQYFPPYRFTAQRGAFEVGKSDNSFYTFKTGDLNWLVVSLEFCARREPVMWADSIVNAHPAYNVIVQTHYHLTPAGEIATTNAGYGDLSPLEIYNLFLKKHKNILLVLSGHVGYSAHRTDIGDNGNTIYEILQDYQNEDEGGGYIRLLDVDVDAKTIDAKMYSPFYDKYKTDSSAFQLTGVDFVRQDTSKFMLKKETTR